MHNAVEDATKDYRLADAIFRGIAQQILSSVSEQDSAAKRAAWVKRLQGLALLRSRRER